MQSGKLRHRVDIQALTRAYGTDGHPTDTWATSVSVWAWVKPLSARELMEARSQESQVSHQVIMRYEDCPTLTMAHRLKYGDRVLNIGSLFSEGERDRQWVAMCIEVV